MQKRTKRSISIIAIAAAVVFCAVVFALCVLDVRAKQVAELSAGAYEIHNIAVERENIPEPETVSYSERAETVYNATPVPEKPKTVQTYSKSEAVQTTESVVAPLAEAGESNSNAVATVSDTVPEEIIESGLEGEVDYDTSYIDELFIFDLCNNGTEYEVRAKDRSIIEAVIPKIYKGKPVTAVANNAFGNCREVIRIILPYGLKRIGNNAFVLCEKLQRLYVPETVTWIGSNAFAYCDNLTELILPNNIELRNTILRPNPRQQNQVVE